MALLMDEGIFAALRKRTLTKVTHWRDWVMKSSGMFVAMVIGARLVVRLAKL